MFKLGSQMAVAVAVAACSLLYGCEMFEDTTGPVPCSRDALVIGEGGQFTQQVLDVEWDASELGMLVLREPIKLRFAADTVGAVISLVDEGRVVAFDEIRLDDRVVGGLYDYTGQTLLSRLTPAWNNAVSAGFPSNGETVPGLKRCLDVEVLALGDAVPTDAAELHVTSVRRPNAALGTQFDVEFRVFDDAVDEAELVAFSQALRAAFAAACNERDCPEPVISQRYFSLTSEDGAADGDVEIDPEMSPDLIYAQLGAWTSPEANPRGLRVVFVRNLYFDGVHENLTTLGYAGGIPAVPVDGTSASSLFLAAEPHRRASDGALFPGYLAETAMHEIGHMLGLFHTTEAAGDLFDPIADTPTCPASDETLNDQGQIRAELCDDAENVMFWTVSPGRTPSFSRGQIFVLRSHPLLYLPTGGGTQP